MSVQEALKLGAFDLKRTANRNLAIAYGAALLIFIVLLGYPTVASIFEEEEPEEALVAEAVTLEDFVEEEEQVKEEMPPPEDVPPPPPPPMAAVQQDAGTGSAGRMGRIEATNEALDDLPPISDMDEISFSDDKGGGTGAAKAAAPIVIPDDMNEKTAAKREKVIDNTPQEEYPSFIGDATQPSYNPADLKANIVYPQLALEQGIEGRVIVLVKINERGDVVSAEPKTRVDPLLDKAAVEAVKKTQFSPAIQNGQAIKMSLLVPVSFQLQ